MKKTVLSLLSDLQGRLLGYFSVMSYGYCQLCVKADPSSLLGFEHEHDGEISKIENLAEIGVHDEPEHADKLEVYPRDPRNLPVLMQGIMEIHPEFRQSLEKYKDADANDDSLESKYLRLTMPEVNDERRDLLLTAVDALDTECKLKYDAMKAKYLAKITKLLLDTPQELDEAKAHIDQLLDEANAMRQQMTDDKKKEVEEAYGRYLARQRPATAAPSPTSSFHPDTNIGQTLRMD